MEHWPAPADATVQIWFESAEPYSSYGTLNFEIVQKLSRSSSPPPPPPKRFLQATRFLLNGPLLRKSVRATIGYRW